MTVEALAVAVEQLLADSPYIDEADIRQALAFASRYRQEPNASPGRVSPGEAIGSAAASCGLNFRMRR